MNVVNKFAPNHNNESVGISKSKVLNKSNEKL